MLDTRSNNSLEPDTQRAAWSDREIEKLKKLAPGKPRKTTLLSEFPGRTLGSIKVHLYHIRRELGIPKCGAGRLTPVESEPTMLDPSDPGLRDNWSISWRRNAASSNERFLQALQQVA